MTSAALTGWGNSPRHSDQRRSLHVSGGPTTSGSAAHRHETTPRVAMCRVDALHRGGQTRIGMCRREGGRDRTDSTVRSLMNMYRTPRPVCGNIGAKTRRRWTVNTAMHQFLHGMSTATAFIRRGAAKKVLVIGVGNISNSWIGKIAMSR